MLSILFLKVSFLNKLETCFDAIAAPFVTSLHNKLCSLQGSATCTVKKKVREFTVPSRDVTTKLSLGGNNDVITELFLSRGSLVDIPARDGKLVNLFFYGVVPPRLFNFIHSFTFFIYIFLVNSHSPFRSLVFVPYRASLKVRVSRCDQFFEQIPQ